jgi:hypothetical protein
VLIPFAGVSFGVLFYDGFMFEDTAVLAPDLTAGGAVLAARPRRRGPGSPQPTDS